MTDVLVTDSVELIVVPDTSIELVTVAEPTVHVLEVGGQGPPGPPGDGNATALVSTDASNRLRTGTDAKLYVPDDLTPDPLAYYILAKN